MRVLFLSRWFPFPPDNGSRMRVLNLLQHLASQHTVDLLAFTSEPVSETQMMALRQYCHTIETVPYTSFRPYSRQALGGLISRQPRSFADTYSSKFQDKALQLARAHQAEIIVGSTIEMIPYAAAIEAPVRIAEEIELSGFQQQVTRQRHLHRRIRPWLMWQKLKRYIGDQLQTFDGCTVVSERELALIRTLALRRCPVRVIPNGAQLSSNIPDSFEQDTLIYSGALSYHANLDAVGFFVREIFPIIKAQRPQVKLFVTGAIETGAIGTLPKEPGVIFTGYLDDIRSKIAQCWASVVPLRIGGGTRLKILESLAIGTPVIATSKGAEGLDLIAGRDILIADEPAEFAEAVIRLLTDVALRAQLSSNGRKVVGEKYDWSRIGQHFLGFVDEVVTKKQLV